MISLKETFVDYFESVSNDKSLITEADNKTEETMYVTGVFLKSGIVSANGYYYPEEVVKKFVEQINSSNMPITMWTSHFAPDSILYTVGKLESAWYDEETQLAWFKAKIANTSIGKDVQMLIKEGFVKGVSIRYIPLDYEEMDTEEQKALKIKDGMLLGIDFASNPSVPGASVRVYSYEEKTQEDADEKWVKFVREVITKAVEGVNKEGRDMPEKEEVVESVDEKASEEVVSIDSVKKEYEEKLAELRAALELLGKEKSDLEEENKALTDELNKLKESFEALKEELKLTEKVVFDNVKKAILESLGEYKASKTFVDKISRDIEKIPYPEEGTLEERLEAYKSELESIVDSFKIIIEELKKQVTSEKLPKGGSVKVGENVSDPESNIRSQIRDILSKHEFVVDKEGDTNG